MTDVFVATIADDDIRDYLYLAVKSRWLIDSLANVKTIGNPHGRNYYDIEIPRERMQRERRIKADLLSQSEVYIVADDDCMPIGIDFIARGLAVMSAHPEFGVLAAMNVWTRNDQQPYVGSFIDDDVWECHAVGGIRFCRKGIIQQWPESVNSGSYDCQHHEALVKAGYKAGYIRSVTMNHIGYGLSQHWPTVSEMDQLYGRDGVPA